MADPIVTAEPAEHAVVSVDVLDPDPMNPNVEDLGTFNELVESIRRDGFLEPVTVTPVPDVPGRYWIVSGEHRWKAAKLAGLTAIPVVIKGDWDEDQRRIAMVRMNVLRGKLNPKKFVELWGTLERKYGRVELQRRMGLASHESELNRLLKSVSAGLPPQLQAELQKRAEKIRKVEDLAAVVQSLFTKYGSTVEAHYIVFAFAGRTHLMIRASDETFGPIARLADACQQGGVALDAVLALRAQCPCAVCQLPTGADGGVDPGG